jgi:hypothetical protein
MLQASGEYMLSTAVQASPECCVSNLMLKADKGSVLSTAAFMEVLEDNGDMQVGKGVGSCMAIRHSWQQVDAPSNAVAGQPLATWTVLVMQS